MSPPRYGEVGTGQGSTPPHTGGSPVSAFCSMFSQLLKLFPRTEFQALVKRTYAERHARGFTCWGQFVAMLFCQLGRAHSLREICGGLRSSEGKVKLHCLLDHDGYLPSLVVITEGKRQDLRVARTLRFAPGTIVVMDRGYIDYAWFEQLTAQGVWFVTRLKAATVYQAVEERPIPARGRVVRDQVIRLTGRDAVQKCPHALRRIEVFDPETAETLVFLTNHLAFGATTIAAIYKDRWQI